MKTDQNIYFPGMYGGQRISTAKMADQVIREWELKKQMAKKKQTSKPSSQTFHYICFSRKIGVGALEIADILAEKIGWKVVDREIMKCMAEDRSLQSGPLDDSDERYPVMISEFASLLFGKKSLVKGDYTRHLVNAVAAAAQTDSTIFVGWATHLLLPRHQVLAVRFIASRSYREKRVAEIMGTGAVEAARILDREEKFQRDFFKKHLGKTNAPTDEFDIVVNRDYFADAAAAADLVQKAFHLKFGKQVKLG